MMNGLHLKKGQGRYRLYLHGYTVIWIPRFKFTWGGEWHFLFIH